MEQIQEQARRAHIAFASVALQILEFLEDIQKKKLLASINLYQRQHYSLLASFHRAFELGPHRGRDTM